MNVQQISSIVRQVGAVAISAAYTGLLAAGNAKQIPQAVDAIIVAFGPAILLLEHFLGDPSTGTPTTTTTTSATFPTAPKAPPS
jgi:hypothetical protein